MAVSMLETNLVQCKNKKDIIGDLCILACIVHSWNDRFISINNDWHTAKLDAENSSTSVYIALNSNIVYIAS